MNHLKKYLKFRLKFILVTAIFSTAVYLFVTSNIKHISVFDKQLSYITELNVEKGSIIKTGLSLSPDLKSATHFSTILFLASKPGEKNRDLYIADIKIAPADSIVDIKNVVNLTNTKAGDEFAVKYDGMYAVTATRALGMVRSLTVFNLNGEDVLDKKTWTGLQKILSSTGDWIKTGRLNGIGKMTIRFKEPAKKIEYSLISQNNKTELYIEWVKKDNLTGVAAVNLSEGNKELKDLKIIKEVRLPKEPVLWLVDTVRTMSAVGPAPIEWAEGRMFDLKDRLNRFKYSIAGDTNDEDIDDYKKSVKEAKKIKLTLSDKEEVGSYSLTTWPPKDLEPAVFSQKKSGEGVWIPALPEFVNHLENAPYSVYQTYIRTDLKRPYVRVKLFAIDTRQLSLHMVGGHEDPISTTGDVGTGKIPRDPDILKRVTLAFNGAFKTVHGEYGMMAEKSVLLPPKDDGATVATDDNGIIGMGSWPKDAKIPDNMVSLRQNMDPLIENGVVNPKRRYLWGFTLDEDITKMNTIRSGICMRDDGILVYAWGDELTGDTLGKAMIAAGCNYGIHLDMNPFHTVLAAFQFKPYKEGVPEFSFKKLIKDVKFWPNRFVTGAPKDFFYMALRDNRPEGDGWSSKNITQPAPGFLPSIFKKVKEGLFMVAVDLNSTKFSIHNQESSLDSDMNDSTSAEVQKPEKMESDIVGRVLLDISKWGKVLTAGGNKISSPDVDRAGLVILKTGELLITRTDYAGNNIESLIEGKWLIHNGQEYKGDGVITAIAVKNSKWLMIVQGNWQDILNEFAKYNISEAIAFNSDGEGNNIMVRHKTQMIGILGHSIKEIDPSITALKIYASKRREYGQPLKNLF
ncbi:MAG: hypothetical protein JXR91_15435 [Deltaproteobacteria bacterium]|nr:hypothetical protein [Deltaproteobacteria bacterium]